MQTLPDKMHLPPHVKVRSRVLKFHLPGHVAKSLAPQSLNYTVGAGRTDGEGVEWTWSSLNGVARCVSMMGPGGRMDTLDDFCNDHNWLKMLNTGTLSFHTVLTNMLIKVCRGPIAS